MVDVFEDLGYTVEWKVLNAWDYGVAEKRQRVVIIGTRNDLKESVKFEYPEPHDYKPVLRDVLQNVPESVGAKYPEKKKKVFDLVPPGGYWRDLPDDVAKRLYEIMLFYGWWKNRNKEEFHGTSHH